MRDIPVVESNEARVEDAKAFAAMEEGKWRVETVEEGIS